MPKKSAKKRAMADARARKKPSTQAGEFVREQMREMEQGRGNAKSPRQAIAIGLSEARREGVKLPLPKKGALSTATRRKVERDRAVGAGASKVSRRRSVGRKKSPPSPRRAAPGN